MDRPPFPIVTVVTDLDVDFELDTNPDGTQTVNLRCGVLIADQHAALINEVAASRLRHAEDVNRLLPPQRDPCSTGQPGHVNCPA